MNNFAKDSLKNIETHLNNERKIQYGMYQGILLGGFCRVMTRNRSYFIEYIVDDKIERVYVDVYPQIVVEKPYRYMAHAYANEETSVFKSGRIDIDDDNGELKIRVETSMVEHAVSVKEIKDMEQLAVHISVGLERRLDKIAHGVPFKRDDPDLMSDAEKCMESIKKRLGSEGESSDDSDSGDSSELDSFIELLSKISSSSDDSAVEEDLDAELSEWADSFEFEDKTEKENEEVDVVLESYGESKLSAIKCVRELIGVSLPEARQIVESAPIEIMKKVSREEAKKAVGKLKEAGAEAKIRSSN